MAEVIASRVAVTGFGIVEIGPSALLSAVRQLVDAAAKAPEERETDKSSQHCWRFAACAPSKTAGNRRWRSRRPPARCLPTTATYGALGLKPEFLPGPRPGRGPPLRAGSGCWDRCPSRGGCGPTMGNCSPLPRSCGSVKGMAIGSSPVSSGFCSQMREKLKITNPLGFRSKRGETT